MISPCDTSSYLKLLLIRYVKLLGIESNSGISEYNLTYLELVNGVEPVFILARAEGTKPAGSDVFCSR